MTVRRSFLSIPASLFLLVVPLVAHAEIKVLTAEANYTMGDGETPSFAEAMVLQKAKQIALEQAGTYVESYTKIKDLDLTVEEIQTIAGGVLQLEVLDKKRSLVGDGLHLYVKIKATVTTDKMQELAQRVKGKNIAEEYKKLQESYDRLSREVESWKKLAEKSPPGPERERALDQLRQSEKTFSTVQMSETALFQRLVSGQSLVRMVHDDEKLIFQLGRILTDGHIIKIGDVKAQPILGSKDQVLLIVPIWLKVSDGLVAQIADISEPLGARIPYRSQPFRILTNNVVATLMNDPNARVTDDLLTDGSVTLLRLAEDPPTAKLFQDLIASLTFSLFLSAERETSYCLTDYKYAYDTAMEVEHKKGIAVQKAQEAQRLWHRIRRVFPVYELETEADVLINGAYEVQQSLEDRKQRVQDSDSGYVAIIHDELEFHLGITVPRDFGSRLTSIKAQIIAKAEVEKQKERRSLCKAIE